MRPEPYNNTKCKRRSQITVSKVTLSNNGDLLGASVILDRASPLFHSRIFGVWVLKGGVEPLRVTWGLLLSPEEF